MRSKGFRTAVFVFVVSAMFGTGLSRTSSATVSDGGICWDPDIEYPVPCDEEEED